MASLLITAVAISCKDEIMKYLLSPICGLIFNIMSVSVDDNPILARHIFRYIQQKALTGVTEVRENGEELLTVGVIYTLAPMIIFDVYRRGFCHNSMVPLGEVDSITIYYYGNIHSLLHDLMSKCKPLPSPYVSVHNYAVHYPSQWELVNRKSRDDIRTPYCSEGLLCQIRAAVERNSSRKKRAFMFNGPSGCGKTTMVLYIAKILNCDIYTIDPSTFFGSMQDEMRRIIRPNQTSLRRCRHNIVLFEDIDRFFGTFKEEEMDLSPFLNFLDGVSTPDNILIIMTCNRKDVIPDVVRRDGRIDFTFEFELLTDKIVRRVCSENEVAKDDYMSWIGQPLAALMNSIKK